LGKLVVPVEHLAQAIACLEQVVTQMIQAHLDQDRNGRKKRHFS
jgi:hypothetical protein